MDNLEKLKSTDKFKAMCEEFCKNSVISQSLYNKFGVKRGLRNSDGSGVVAGITNVCCVHGYVISEGDKLNTVSFRVILTRTLLCEIPRRIS